MIDLEFDEEDTIGSKERSRLAERLFGVNEVVEAHVGIIGELRVGIEQPEKDKIVTGGGSLHECASVGEMGGNAGITVRVLGVMTTSYVEDFWIDFYCIHGLAVMAQSRGNVVSSS